MISLGRCRAALAVVALVLQLPTLLIRRPLILPDEAGFLLNAYQLGAGRPPSGLVYYPGYSVLLAPIATLTTDLGAVMVGVQAVNAVLAVGSILLAFELARRLLPERSVVDMAVIAVVAQLYPAFRMFSTFALSENLFLPISLGLAVLAIDLDRSARPLRPALAIAVVGGAAIAVHARAISITVAALVALGWAWRRRGRRVAPAMAVAALVAVACYLGVRAVLSSRGVEITGTDTDSALSSLVRRNLAFEAVGGWVMGAIGQAFYLVVASLGAVVAAVALLARSVRARVAIPGDALAAFSSLVVPMTVCSFGVSVLFMGGSRGDPAIYGRYNEGVLAPVLVLGLAVLAHAGVARRTLWWAAWAVPLSGLVLVAARPADFYDARRQMINITAIHPVTDTLGGIELGVVVVVALVALAAVRSAFGRDLRTGAAVVGVVWAATVAFDLRAAALALDVLDPQDELLDEIAAAETLGVDASCVTIDLFGIGDRWHEANYRLRRDDIDFRYWVSGGDAPPPCPDLVISRRPDLATALAAGGDDRLSGVTLLAVEPWSRLGLYGSGAAGELARGVRPITDAPYAPFVGDGVDAAQGLQIDVLDVADRATVGDEVTVTVRLTNLGPRALVPHLGLEGAGGVNVGLEWRDPTRPGDRLIEPVRVPLPAIVWPGEAVEVTGTLPAADAPIALGEWLAVAGVVQEGVAWLPAEATATVEVGAG